MSTRQSDQDFDFAEWFTDLSHGAINQRAGQEMRAKIGKETGRPVLAGVP